MLLIEKMVAAAMSWLDIQSEIRLGSLSIGDRRDDNSDAKYGINLFES
jgi:hypothetical protein